MIRTPLRAAALSLLVLLGIAACSDSDLPGGSCGTCAEIYTNGGITCGPGSASDAWRTLSLCACGSGPCGSACGASFCITMPSDQACGECLATSCTAEEATCAAH